MGARPKSLLAGAPSWPVAPAPRTDRRSAGRGGAPPRRARGGRRRRPPRVGRTAGRHHRRNDLRGHRSRRPRLGAGHRREGRPGGTRRPRKKVTPAVAAAVTLFGPIRVTRAYYHGRPCRGGHSPRDAALPAVRRPTRRRGRAGGRPGRGDGVVRRGRDQGPARVVRPAGERVHRRADDRAGGGGCRGATGRRADVRRGEGVGMVRGFRGETVGYASADVTGVGMRGANGAKSEGPTAERRRMASHTKFD